MRSELLRDRRSFCSTGVHFIARVTKDVGSAFRCARLHDVDSERTLWITSGGRLKVIFLP
jgi:hypothetical protein